MSVLVQECDFSLGDLDEYVIRYTVRVTNSEKAAVVAAVTLGDVRRTATLKPGGTIFVSGFKGGSFAVWAVETGERRKALAARREELYAKRAKLANDPARLAEYQELSSELSAIHVLDRDLERNPTGGFCGGELKSPERLAATVTISFDVDVGKFALAGC